ncbi:MAG TPA: hypothetical protein VFB38_05875 [Chthonomonadaceae bacterium]|nr:hypothetical protein [Chthonomonadaceae bacterium]
MLLNLQHQVKLVELPWIKAIEALRHNSLGTQEMARQTLDQVATLAVTAFPHQILPNKLLQELRTLSQNAGLDLPLVDEVAADIFMGAFSEKFLRAAQMAGTLLEGSLYERYYGISYRRVLQINDVQPSRYGGTPTPCPRSSNFAANWRGRPGEARGSRTTVRSSSRSRY